MLGKQLLNGSNAVRIPSLGKDCRKRRVIFTVDLGRCPLPKICNSCSWFLIHQALTLGARAYNAHAGSQSSPWRPFPSSSLHSSGALARLKCVLNHAVIEAHGPRHSFTNMDYTGPDGANEEDDAIIVKADEVDESGADISTISPTDAPEAEFTERIESRRAHDAQSSTKTLANAVPSPPKVANRPILRREGSAPPPPQQAPPPTPPPRQEEQRNPTDSLSLLELKKLVTDLPKLDPTAYAYDYSETRSFPEELEEWFSYTEEERYMLLRANQSFDEKWEQAQAEQPVSSDKALQWQDVTREDRESFLVGAIQALQNPEISSRVKSLECLSYVALGVWGDTAGVEKEDQISDRMTADQKWLDSSNTKPKLQLKWISNGTRMLCELNAVQKLVDVLIRLWESEQSVSPLFFTLILYAMSNC